MAKRRVKTVNLKRIRGPIDSISKDLQSALGSGRFDADTRADIGQLRTALQRVRRQVAAECCDNMWFCTFPFAMKGTVKGGRHK